MSTHHSLPVRHHGETERKAIPNKPAAGIPYFTPAQEPASGTATSSTTPKLFTPLKIRSLTFQNRIFLAPLCQYSAQNGHMSPWHLAHLGGIISRGPGLSFIEATSVTANGRITPEDSGIWLDSQVDAPFGLKTIVDFAHSQNQKIGIQLAHAGRKASTVAPWLSHGAVANEFVNGWPHDVKAPSAVAYNEDHPDPSEMTLEDIKDLKTAWADGVRRALRAGFDVIEIHNAHGYLFDEFLSPASNKRTDKYGGSFENRVRLTLEIVELTRSLIPDSMPLFLRISADDWLSHDGYDGESWTVKDTVKLAPLLAERGVDLLDVSSGGIHPAQKITSGPGYQAPFAKEIKEAVGDKMLVTAVGSIVNGTQAEALLTGKGKEEDSRGEGVLDAVFVGRMFQKNPGLVWSFAEDLEVPIKAANQIGWGFGGRAGGGHGKKHPEW